VALRRVPQKRINEEGEHKVRPYEREMVSEISGEKGFEA
jgi:hypothetical protein